MAAVEPHEIADDRPESVRLWPGERRLRFPFAERTLGIERALVRGRQRAVVAFTPMTTNPAGADSATA